MELNDAIEARRMTRSFCGDPVPRDLLERVVRSVLFAPSAGFTQGVDLLVLTSPERREQFWELASSPAWRETDESHTIRDAPAIIIPVAEVAAYVERYGEPDKATSTLSGEPAPAWPMPYWIVDASFVAMLVLLEAADVGLGSLFFRLHADDHGVLEGLGVPGDRIAIGAIALGYPTSTAPSGSPLRRSKRTFSDTVHFDRW